jgi:type IV secretion system protein VirB5
MTLSDVLYRLKHGRKPPVLGEPGGFPSGDGAASAETPSLSGSEPKRDAKPLPNYLVAGRREFTDQFTNLARGKRNWQLTAFASLGLLAVVTVAYIALASSARVQLLVVEVDELGQVRGFEEVGNVYTAREAVTDATLRHFVRNLRTVYADPAAQRDLIVSAYAYADASTQEWLNGYFSDPENDPRRLMRQLARRVEIKSVIRVPGTEGYEADGSGSDSWKLTWVEVETPRGTDTQRRSAWEAYLTVKQVPEAVRPHNPLGLYVTAINWSRVSGSGVSRSSRPPAGSPVGGSGSSPP